MKTINPEIVAEAKKLGLTPFSSVDTITRVFDCGAWADLTDMDQKSSPETLHEPCLVVIRLEVDATVQFQFPDAVKAMEWMKDLNLYGSNIIRD